MTSSNIDPDEQSQECSAASWPPLEQFWRKLRFVAADPRQLIQNVPNNAAVGSATVAIGRLSKGAGKLPFLSLDAPLDRRAT
jgi:hypothetical protein